MSVVLSTYNRADVLPSALDALLAQTGDVPYEIIVVDNNSTDASAAVVADIAARAGGRVVYAFEPRQGLSYARNTGTAMVRAPIVAFSDDDVRVAPDWILQIARAFEAHPEVDYIGGRVLPRWLQPPPAWLTPAHWSPLALQDYGSVPFSSGRAHAVCLVGANLAFRREVFDRVGLFTPALGRVRDGIGSTEDHDMQLRIWRAGMLGMYLPAVVAIADVTPDRMVKAYHRRWHRGHGRHCAAMRLRELVPADPGPMSEPQDLVLLFGSPGFVYTELILIAGRWLKAWCRNGDTFFYANKLRHFWSYLRAGYERSRATRTHGIVAELAAFASAYRKKRASRRATKTVSAA